MLNSTMIRGVIVPMITVFDDDESIDETGTREHADFLLANGVHGLAPCGSTGEFIAMMPEEVRRVIDMVVDQARGRVPVFAGTGHYSTKATIEMSKYAESAGADGLMIVPPYYLLPPRRLVLDHFRAVKDSVCLPIILYNNPWFAGLELTSWEIAALVDEGVIEGVKVAHGDVGRIHDLKYLCGDKLAVMYGHDVNALEGLLAGADGWISGLPNLIPSEACQLYNYAVIEKDLRKAQDLWMRLLPLFHFDVVIKHNEEPHWLPGIKDGLNLRGRRAGKPRRPLTALRPDELEELRAILARLELLPEQAVRSA